MANHKSAKKRSKQALSRNAANNQYLSRIRTSINNFEEAFRSKKSDELQKLFSDFE